MSFPRLQSSATPVLYRANFPFVGQATHFCLFLSWLCGKAQYSMLSNTAVKILLWSHNSESKQEELSWAVRPTVGEQKAGGCSPDKTHRCDVESSFWGNMPGTPLFCRAWVLKEYSDSLCMHHRLKPSFCSSSGIMIRIKSSDQAAVCKTRRNIWPAFVSTVVLRTSRRRDLFSVQTGRRVPLIVPGNVSAARACWCCISGGFCLGRTENVCMMRSMLMSLQLSIIGWHVPRRLLCTVAEQQWMENVWIQRFNR